MTPSHETVTKDAAIDWMLRDKDNPSSVRLIAAARTTRGWCAPR
jgi:uncharacterized alpha-E superfamily protein